jgi:hypothetical protein
MLPGAKNLAKLEARVADRTVIGTIWREKKDQIKHRALAESVNAWRGVVTATSEYAEKREGLEERLLGMSDTDALRERAAATVDAAVNRAVADAIRAGTECDAAEAAQEKAERDRALAKQRSRLEAFKLAVAIAEKKAELERIKNPPKPLDYAAEIRQLEEEHETIAAQLEAHEAGTDVLSDDELAKLHGRLQAVNGKLEQLDLQRLVDGGDAI